MNNTLEFKRDDNILTVVSSEDLGRCWDCGGYYKLATGLGRRYEMLRGVSLEIPEDLPTIECDNCDGGLSDSLFTGAVQVALEKKLTLIVRKFVSDIIERHNTTQYEFENALKINRSYFSKIMAGMEQPTSIIISVLDMILNVPDVFVRLRLKNEY